MFKAMFGLVFWLLVYAGSGYAAYTFWYLPKYTTQASDAPHAAPRAQAVRVAVASRSDHVITRSVQARVVARKQGMLNFRTSGCIDHVYGDPQPGDVLEQGQLLAKLNDTQARLEVVEGEAEVTQFNARIKETRVELGIKAGVSARSKSALADEHERYQRQKTLFDRDLSTQGVVETAERALRAAEELAEASAEAEVLTQAKLSRLDTELTVISAQLERARNNLADMVLTAPGTVHVIDNKLRVGNCVTAATPVFDTYDPSSLEINAEVPALLTSKVSEHLDLAGLSVTFDAPFKGCMSKISGSETATDDPNARVLRIPVPRDCEQGWAFNQRLAINLPMQAFADIIRLPKSAECQTGMVFVVTDDKLSRREVAIEARDENWIYVSDGLNTGDRVLASDPDFAVEGLRVKVVAP